MNEFVQECRREWKRLRVPDAVANEMAADLEADLEEAAADGVSAEEVLGSGAFDPRSFAASWAAERGVIQSAPAGIRTLQRRSRIPAAIVAFALVAIVGALLAILASAAHTVRVALAAPPIVREVSPGLWWRVVGPQERLVLPVRPSRFEVVPPPVRGSSEDLRRVGLIVLLVGVVGTIFSGLLWLSGRTAPSEDTHRPASNGT